MTQVVVQASISGYLATLGTILGPKHPEFDLNTPLTDLIPASGNQVATIRRLINGLNGEDHLVTDKQLEELSTVGHLIHLVDNQITTKFDQRRLSPNQQ